MHKVPLAIIAFIIAVMGLAWFINDKVDSKTTIRQSQDTVATLEANVGISKEAKNKGELATTSADKAKAESRKQAEKLRSVLRETSSSIDDMPLSPSDIGIMCRAYHRTDGVCSATSEPVGRNKG